MRYRRAHWFAFLGGLLIGVGFVLLINPLDAGMSGVLSRTLKEAPGLNMQIGSLMTQLPLHYYLELGIALVSIVLFLIYLRPGLWFKCKWLLIIVEALGAAMVAIAFMVRSGQGGHYGLPMLGSLYHIALMALGALFVLYGGLFGSPREALSDTQPVK
jgi:hypothetical protein